MIETVAATLAGLRTAVGLAKDAIDARDGAKLAEVKSVLIDRILDVQTACLALQETNAALIQQKATLAEEKRSLEGDLMKAREQADKLAQYERFRTPIGAIVFVDKTTKDASDDAVYACAACMDEGKVSTLQPIHSGKMLVCHTHGKFGFSVEPNKIVIAPLRI